MNNLLQKEREKILKPLAKMKNKLTALMDKTSALQCQNNMAINDARDMISEKQSENAQLNDFNNSLAKQINEFETLL